MLKKSDLNCEIKAIVASGPGGVIWLSVNPATDMVSYRLEVNCEKVVESKSIDQILCIYNKWSKNDKR